MTPRCPTAGLALAEQRRFALAEQRRLEQPAVRSAWISAPFLFRGKVGPPRSEQVINIGSPPGSQLWGLRSQLLARPTALGHATAGQVSTGDREEHVS